MDPKECEYCGNSFTSKHKKQKFCSNPCRFEGSRETVRRALGYSAHPMGNTPKGKLPKNEWIPGGLAVDRCGDCHWINPQGCCRVKRDPAEEWHLADFRGFDCRWLEWREMG